MVTEAFVTRFLAAILREPHLARQLTDDHSTRALCKTVCGEYIKIIRAAAELNANDLKVIGSAYGLYARQIAAGGEQEQSMCELIAILGEGHAEIFRTVAASACAAHIPLQEAAITDLLKRMQAGYELANRGIVLRDGDQLSDQAIWTQTKFRDPERLLYVVCAHYFERFSYHLLAAYHRSLPKDLFLNALDDVVILNRDQDTSSRRLYSMWANPIGKGGIGYLNPAKVTAFLRAHKNRVG